MDSPVFIYASNTIRGHILQNALESHNISASRHSRPKELETALTGALSPIIILDLVATLPADLTLRGRLAGRFPDAMFITLVDPMDAPLVQESAGVNEICVLSPISPHHIRQLVQETLDLETRATALKSRESIAVHLHTDPPFIQNIQPDALPAEAPSKGWRISARSFLRLIALLTALSIGATGGYLTWCYVSLPDVDLLEHYSLYQTSHIYTDDNHRLTDFFVERRTLTPYSELPDSLIQAILAIEDTRYFKHSGVDPIRIIGAAYSDLKAGSLEQGGSTITQQLAKMIFLSPEKTVFRKIREILLSLKIEKRYSKREVLEMYLNRAYFGAQAYGIDTASRTYFNKPAAELSLPESALLAGMLKAPSTYSPFSNAKATLSRRNQVLKRMREEGFIDDVRLQDAMSAPLPTKPHRRNHEAAYFVDYCRRTLEDRIGERLYTSGFSIYTTLDHQLQKQAEMAVRTGIETFSAKYPGTPPLQSALISMEIKTGRIKAMVGGTDFWISSFNRATQAKRQPGSAFKPFVYLTALEQGYTPNSRVQDLYRVYNKGTAREWAPRNYRNRYHGEVTLNQAMSRSMNAATVALAKQVGIDAVIATSRRLGVESEISRVYPSALGASEVTLMELVTAYAAMASGHRVMPVCIDRIIDKDRSIMIQPVSRREQVIRPDVLESLRFMLRSVVTHGTGSAAARLNRPVYGKTGTTNNSSDSLFIGFDDHLVTGVWMGRDDNSPIGRTATGANTALSIWLNFMASPMLEPDPSGDGAN